jgi:uncharacterized Zn finger protein
MIMRRDQQRPLNSRKALRRRIEQVEAKRFMDLIEKADKERLKRALAGLFYGDYRVRALEQKNGEVRAYISNKDGKDYGVAINESETFCHCPDYFFTNESICKHILMLSFILLSRIRREESSSARCEVRQRASS